MYQQSSPAQLRCVKNITLLVKLDKYSTSKALIVFQEVISIWRKGLLFDGSNWVHLCYARWTLMRRFLSVTRPKLLKKNSYLKNR